MNVAALTAADTAADTAAESTDGARLRTVRTARTADILDDPLEQARFTRWIISATGERQGDSSLQLSGMHCAACAGQVEAALLALSGVHEVRVSAASQHVSVTWDPSCTRPSAMVEALRRAGYDAVPDAASSARALRQREARQALWRLFVAAFCAMQVMMLATPSYVAGAGELSAEMRRLLDWGSWTLTLPVLVFSCGPFFQGARRNVVARRIGMDVPVALGVLIMFIASTGAAFEPGGHFGSEVYFDSLTMFVSFLLGARYLEMRARHRAAEEMEGQWAGLPESAERVLGNGAVEVVSALRLSAGDRVRVPLGQAFPADGEIIEGNTFCDESVLTGESLPLWRGMGEAVVAGSINVGSPVDMSVHRVGPDTRLKTIVAMMRTAATQRPALARSADRWAGPFLWVVLLLAAGAAAAWSLVDPSKVLWVAVSVLIVTCPCALSLAAPSTVLAAARAWARRGVMVQRLDAIESLARAEHFFFDKTGTLTLDVPTLIKVTLTRAGRARLGTEAQAVTTAWALAERSRHPLSQALVVAARAASGGAPTAEFARFEEHSGEGVQAKDSQGGSWRLGSVAWTASLDVAGSRGGRDGPSCSSGPSGPSDRDDGDGRDGRDGLEGHVWLAAEGVPLAAFEFEETLRPGAAEAVAALLAEGLHVTLLSGDHRSRAQALADRLGITEVVAEASPADKLQAVALAQAAGRRVAMVGDGVNDAPVLARADVALAMGQGALVARSQADAVLVSGRPLDLLQARRTAKIALRIVHQNLAWAAAYNAVCVPLALLGWLPPWAAGLGMAASSLLVVGNALRAAR